MDAFWLEFKLSKGIGYHFGTFNSAVAEAESWLSHPDSVVCIYDGENHKIAEIGRNHRWIQAAYA